MSRLNLVIADREETYVKKLSDFLAYKYSNRFRVSYFTKHNCLIDFIEGGDKKADILLVDKGMYNEGIPCEKVGTVILLTNGRPSAGDEGYRCVNKYQHGDRLVGDIMELLTQESIVESVQAFMPENRKTGIIMFFSPAGGSGTTCITMGASVQCAMRGMTVLYLDFQTLNCTEMFLKSGRAHCLSDILYFLKDNETNLTARIEAARCIDMEYNVHFFSPAQSGMELNEVTPEEYMAFIRQIRDMGQYDVVFIDASAEFALKNVEVLGKVDQIFLIMRQDALCIKKSEMMFDELSILEQKKGVALMDRTDVIINRCMEESPEDIAPDFIIRGKAPAFALPFSPGIAGIKGLKPLTNMEDGFNKGINLFLNKRVFR